MNTMKHEMQEDRLGAVRQIIIKVEQEAVQRVFQNGPDDVTGEKAS